MRSGSVNVISVTIAAFSRFRQPSQPVNATAIRWQVGCNVPGSCKLYAKADAKPTADLPGEPAIAPQVRPASTRPRSTALQSAQFGGIGRCRKGAFQLPPAPGAHSFISGGDG